jgi:hypothetical protein
MKNYAYRIFSLILISFAFLNNSYSQDYKIIKSDDTQLILEFDFSNKFEVKDVNIDGIKFTNVTDSQTPMRKPGDPYLPIRFYEVGIPLDKNAIVNIQEIQREVYPDKFVISTPDSADQSLDKLNYNEEIYGANSYFPLEAAEINSQYIFRYIKTATLLVSPYQFNPVDRTLVLNKRIIVKIEFKDDANFQDLILPITDRMTEDLIKTNFINSQEALTFLGKVQLLSDSPQEKYWYDPNKVYYKIYLGEKGVYRISYDLLVSLNIPINSVEINKLQIFNNGIEIPLYVKDADNNELFNSGDYVEFVGFPPQATQFSYFNIYNKQNIYWFSFQADSTGKRYSNKDGYPVVWVNSFATTPFIAHFEKDSLYERLGHASNDQRDYWYWGKSSGTNGNLTSLFSAPFSTPSRFSPNATQITVRVNMHGMTTNQCINPDHKAKILLTSQLIGEHTWDGPNSSTFQTVVDLSQINIFPENNLQVATYGDIDTCNPNNPNEIRNDEIRVNWFELEYPREHRAFENSFNFLSPPNVYNFTRFSVFNWQRDDIKIFIPQNSEMIINANITNDEFKNVFFVDNLSERKEYFCVAEDFFISPDSIVIDRNHSDLRNNSNGVDYLIITHSKFLNAANELAEFRRSNFPDLTIPAPRIQVVNIEDIYDEFSYGLLNPNAIKDFINYTFNYWVSPSLTYVVLLGDMSYDYRSILAASRPNFIPSLPYHVQPYGQSVSDNNFVAIVGNDIIPDLAIGRLSCETEEEAAILINKIVNYPLDPGKHWKQNILLISSGLNQADEDLLQFNNSNIYLDQTYLKPNGLVSEKIFRFPRDSTHTPFQGGGPEIRQGFNYGAVVASYYGHGGGYQWDLVFNNDDIFLLQNENRLPFITSVTCYTAHFDNQDIFGEQFNKVPGKGSIAFWGSSGLTFWYSGKQLNQRLFSQLFTQKVHVIGKAILNAKTGVGNDPMVSLLTLLGDPVLSLAIPDKPDFTINSSNISVFPKNPQKDDTISVYVKVNNLGVTFPNQVVSLEMRASSIDTSYSVDTLWISSFGETDSVEFSWHPERSGVYNLEFAINEMSQIPEMDYTDNQSTINLIIYDLSEPNIIKPIDGYMFNKDSVIFIFVDPGYYSLTDLDYFIEIDTTQSFQSPVLKSDVLKPTDGTLIWQTSILNPGLYFWRSRMLSVDDSSNWSDTRIFSISDSSKLGYYVTDKHLESLSSNNLIYSDSLRNLVLNVDFLPPRPTNDKLLEFINIALPSDLTSLSAITTDGTFIYVGHMAYYSGVSKIYKFGTGYNGTIAGQIYGEIPNLLVPIWHSMIFYPDQSGGSLYISTGDAFSLLKVNPINGDTSRVNIPHGLLNSVDSRVRDGAFYLNTDGRYIYNVAYINENGEFKYRVRIFDPLTNWTKLKDDLIPNGSSYHNFAGFFIAEGYFYPYENFQEGWLRRINLQTGDYEEEWRSFEPFQGFYAWVYDWINDVVYASVFQTNFSPKIAKFVGNYLDAFGSVSTAVVGPANKWDKLYYDIDSENSDGVFSVMLQGLNKNTKSWDTLATNVDSEYDLSYLDYNTYKYLKSKVSVVDSSYGLSSTIKIKGIGISYIPPPEIMISSKSISFQSDTVLQGLNTILTTRISNIGYSEAKNIKLDYFISDNQIHSDTALFSNIGDVPQLSEIEFIDTINTTPYLFENVLKLQANYQDIEFYSFNNFAENIFYVARDSANPLFNITFDGSEILNGDVVSSEPVVVITLEDNSPLPIDSTYFTIVHTYNNIPKVLRVPGPDITFEQTPYPNNRAVITWTPKLADGRHVLEVLAKDASGNFFDSTSSRSVFNVYNNPDLLQVYNYPNPFSDNTNFTFELRGIIPPEEFKIKIFTVAGRLIKELSPSSPLQIGFNKIYWDGKDQDGDEIANGLYFYKIISKHGDEVKTVTQKLAKVK